MDEFLPHPLRRLKRRVAEPADHMFLSARNVNCTLKRGLGNSGFAEVEVMRRHSFHFPRSYSARVSWNVDSATIIVDRHNSPHLVPAKFKDCELTSSIGGRHHSLSPRERRNAFVIRFDKCEAVSVE